VLGILSPIGFITAIVVRLTGIVFHFEWLSWLGLLTGVSAIVLGHIAKSTIRRTGQRPRDVARATAGLILGYGTFIVVFGTVLVLPIPESNPTAANASAAAGSLRALNDAQTVYAGRYPRKGFAASLVDLGPGQPAADCATRTGVDSKHACLLDAVLGCASSYWCNRSGYRFKLIGFCDGGKCSDYVITATPQKASSGKRNFCSMADKVVRTHPGGVLTAPVTVEECRSWEPIF
jgi:hypothetical protein